MMKKAIAIISIIVITMLSISSVANAEGSLQDLLDILNGKKKEADVPLVSLEDFVYYFNFYGALFGDGHELSIENISDSEKVGDEILFKTIFNDCEVLTLMLSADVSEVKSIHCTWVSNMQGASDYMIDFLQMLMETLMACGMESDSISSLFTDLGEANAFNVGDSGEMTVDGIKVSYEVTVYSGVSFTIERE